MEATVSVLQELCCPSEKQEQTPESWKDMVKQRVLCIQGDHTDTLLCRNWTYNEIESQGMWWVGGGAWPRPCGVDRTLMGVEVTMQSQPSVLLSGVTLEVSGARQVGFNPWFNYLLASSPEELPNLTSSVFSSRSRQMEGKRVPTNEVFQIDKRSMVCLWVTRPPDLPLEKPISRSGSNS